MTPLYILASSCLSPQATFGQTTWPLQPIGYRNRLTCIEPDFRAYINPVQIRRMSRILKIGYSTAIHCLQQRKDQQVDAMLIGTGRGCLEDTEHFLHDLQTYQETALNATHFIHSTYNQLNGMIALHRKISTYNMTYVHRGFSFEHALLDAALLMAEEQADTVLCGSFDEMTEEHFQVKQQWGYWKTEELNTLELFQHPTNGCVAGEGAAFFLLSRQPGSTTRASIRGCMTLYQPALSDIQDALQTLLQNEGITAAAVSVLLSGANGHAAYASDFAALEAMLPASVPLYYKHLCGEYDTAVSFALWLGQRILETQEIPHDLVQTKTTRPLHVACSYIILYSNYFGRNQSLLLLRREEGAGLG